jgi:hypothetical protein
LTTKIVKTGKRGAGAVVYGADFCAAVVKHYAYDGSETAQDFDASTGTIGLTSYIQGVTGWLPSEYQASPAARQQVDRILDKPNPWVALYEKDFCTKVYTWYGPNFYWEFCYYFLSPIERCRLNELNPVTNGERRQRIHQYLEQHTRDRLERYVWQLIAIVNVSDNKQQFIRAYQKAFGIGNQLKLL